MQPEAPHTLPHPPAGWVWEFETFKSGHVEVDGLVSAVDPEEGPRVSIFEPGVDPAEDLDWEVILSASRVDADEENNLAREEFPRGTPRETVLEAAIEMARSFVSFSQP